MGFLVTGSYVPCPTVTCGGRAGRSTTIIGASLPSRVARRPSDGRNVLNRPVLMSPTFSVDSCRQSAPAWCAAQKAWLRKFDESPRPTWYIEPGVASPSKLGALMLGIAGAAAGGTQEATFTGWTPTRVPKLAPWSTVTLEPAASDRSSSASAGAPKPPSIAPRPTRPSTPRKRGTHLPPAPGSMQMLFVQTAWVLLPSVDFGQSAAVMHAWQVWSPMIVWIWSCRSGLICWRTKFFTGSQSAASQA